MPPAPLIHCQVTEGFHCVLSTTFHAHYSHVVNQLLCAPNRVPISCEVLMFVCPQKDSTNIRSHSLVVLIVMFKFNCSLWHHIISLISFWRQTSKSPKTQVLYCYHNTSMTSYDHSSLCFVCSCPLCVINLHLIIHNVDLMCCIGVISIFEVKFKSQMTANAVNTYTKCDAWDIC